MEFHVYILWSDTLKKCYVGFTSKLDARVFAHNNGIKGWSTRGRPWKLIYSEQFATKKEAMVREAYLKSGAGRTFIQRQIFDHC